MSGADALEAELFQCDMDEMDQKLAGCLEDMDMRVKTLEQAVLSGEGKKGRVVIVTDEQLWLNHKKITKTSVQGDTSG